MIQSKVRSGVCALALAAGGLLAGPAQGQEDGSGTRLSVEAVEIDIGGRVQTQFNTTSADTEPATEIFLRRVRLEAEVTISDRISGEVQTDFAGDRVALKDAYLKLSFAPGFQVLAGRAHRPFSRLELTSSNRMPPVERGAAIRGIDALDEYELVHGLAYSDRDIGLQVMGEPEGAPLGFGYQVGVFGGPLQGEVGTADTYQLAARITLRPAEEVSIGAGWSGRDFAEPGPGAGNGFELERGNAFEVDLEYGAFDPGFHLLGELAVGDYDPFTGADFSGAQAWLAYRTGAVGGVLAAVEPTFRASYGDVDVEGGVGSLGGTLLTPGLNFYFDGLNRVLFNYDLWMPAGDGDAEASFKAQFQMAF